MNPTDSRTTNRTSDWRGLALRSSRVLLLGLACAATTAALAGPDDSRRGEHGKRGHVIDLAEAEAKHAERLAAVDTDGDGNVSLEEFLAADRSALALAGRMGRFGGRHGPAHRAGRIHIATHGLPDGAEGPEALSVIVDDDAVEVIEMHVDTDEIEAVTAEATALAAEHMARLEERLVEHRTRRGEQGFDMIDTDGDGMISQAEYEARHEARHDGIRQRLFERLDRNGDEILDSDELNGRLDRLRALDADNDGIVSRSEMRSGMRERRQWHRSNG